MGQMSEYDIRLKPKLWAGSLFGTRSHKLCYKNISE